MSLSSALDVLALNTVWRTPGHPRGEKLNMVLQTTHNNFSNYSWEDCGLGTSTLETYSTSPNPRSQRDWATLEESE